MTLLPIFLICGAVFLLAYVSYGRVLSRLLRLDPKAPTPAVTLRDDLDYVPIEPKFLLSQHFSAIAAAGPIVGPILAGLAFGWAPAIIWIVLGSIFLGGVHDITSLVASIRHRARSIAEVVREHMSRGAYLLFLTFIWIALVYIIVAFTDIVASSMVGVQKLENAMEVRGGATATSSLLYLALPIIMGLLMRYTKLSLGLATVLFLPLVGVAIWVGPMIPLDLAAIFGVSDAKAVKIWDFILLAYCLIAAVVPMWLLLQPRGHLGGYFLLIALVGGSIGILLGNVKVQYPAFTGWVTATGGPLFPMLFITIACGACSGFHAIIASGTTSKQLRRETDAVSVGYGSMLLEGMVAVMSLACVMILTPESSKGLPPNLVYAGGLGSFLEVLRVPTGFAIAFSLLAFTTFVYDTLDVCTRLGRYIIQELTGWHGAGGRWAATIVTAGTPALFVLQTTTDAAGKPMPAWKVFWSLFGASNQLLAALTLLGVTVWLWQTRRAMWVWLVTGLPTAVMYVMSVWALWRMMLQHFNGTGLPRNPVPWVAIVLILLAGLVLVEAVRVFLRTERRPPPEAMQPAFAT